MAFALPSTAFSSLPVVIPFYESNKERAPYNGNFSTSGQSPDVSARPYLSVSLGVSILKNESS